jgi:hypothetical protein
MGRCVEEGVMAVRKGVLFEVQQSLIEMRSAKTQFVPLSTDHSNPSAMNSSTMNSSTVAFQIGLRDIFLSGLRTIRISLARRMKYARLAGPMPVGVGRARRKRRSRAAAPGRAPRRARR